MRKTQLAIGGFEDQGKELGAKEMDNLSKLERSIISPCEPPERDATMQTFYPQALVDL